MTSYSNCWVIFLSIMQKDLPTISYEQYESIKQLQDLKPMNSKSINSPNHYPDKLSLFLNNYHNEIINKSKENPSKHSLI